LISDFILNSKNIELAIHLLDSRHNPSELDIRLNELLIYAQIPSIVLLNKADKLKQSEFKVAVTNISNTFPELLLDENLFFYSATKGRGKKEITKRLSKLFYLK
jgi:GTP-binding protein